MWKNAALSMSVMDKEVRKKFSCLRDAIFCP